jgi:hypothetical protein
LQAPEQRLIAGARERDRLSAATIAVGLAALRVRGKEARGAEVGVAGDRLATAAHARARLAVGVAVAIRTDGATRTLAPAAVDVRLAAVLHAVVARRGPTNRVPRPRQTEQTATESLTDVRGAIRAFDAALTNVARWAGPAAIDVGFIAVQLPVIALRREDPTVGVGRIDAADLAVDFAAGLPVTADDGVQGTRSVGVAFNHGVSDAGLDALGADVRGALPDRAMLETPAIRVANAFDAGLEIHVAKQVPIAVVVRRARLPASPLAADEIVCASTRPAVADVGQALHANPGVRVADAIVPAVTGLDAGVGGDAGHPSADAPGPAVGILKALDADPGVRVADLASAIAVVAVDAGGRVGAGAVQTALGLEAFVVEETLDAEARRRIAASVIALVVRIASGRGAPTRPAAPPRGRASAASPSCGAASSAAACRSASARTAARRVRARVSVRQDAPAFRIVTGAGKGRRPRETQYEGGGE